jgi:hypothetical protein
MPQFRQQLRRRAPELIARELHMPRCKRLAITERAQRHGQP